MTRTRLLAALFMTPIAIAAVLFLPTPWLVAMAAVLFLAGLWEWFRLAEIDDTLQRTTLLVANLALMVALVWAQSRGGGSLPLFRLAIVTGVIWWLLAMLWLKHYDFASDHDTHARAFKLAAGTLAVVPAWCALALIHVSEPNGHRWLLLALFVIWAADTGAYFVGSRFGKRKLAPRISPGKSWEGLFGGLAASELVALACMPGLHVAWPQAPAFLLLVVVTVAVSVLGDLFESLLKRHAGVKDSIDLIPGHGGILDRIDSLLAALPVFVVLRELLL